MCYIAATALQNYFSNIKTKIFPAEMYAPYLSDPQWEWDKISFLLPVAFYMSHDSSVLSSLDVTNSLCKPSLVRDVF